MHELCAHPVAQTGRDKGGATLRFKVGKDGPAPITIFSCGEA